MQRLLCDSASRPRRSRSDRGGIAAIVFLLALFGLVGCGGHGGGNQGGSPVSIQQRHAAIEAVETAFQALPAADRNAQNQQLAALMGARPEFEASGVSDDGCAWGRFTDGRLLIVANNRTVPSGRMVRIPPAPRSGRAAGTGLPEKTIVHLYDTMGTAFGHPSQAFQSTLAGHGYQIAGGGIQKGTVADLKLVQGDGIYYMDAHGGSGKLRDGRSAFSIWTATKQSDELEVTFDDDLNSNRLVYMTAPGDLVPTDHTKVRIETHYAATPLFVDRYMRFGRNSLVYINACSSNSPGFRGSCIGAGAGLYLGWTTPVRDDSASGAAAFLFDRMFGDNAVAPQDSPTKPPLDWAELQAAMASTTNPVSGAAFDTSPGDSSSPESKLIFTAGSGDLGVITPSIHEVSVDTSANEVTLSGVFGSSRGVVEADGSVFIQGTALQVKSWSATQIVAALTPDAKSVIVRVNGRPSNVKAVAAGEYVLSGTGGGSFNVDDNLTVWVKDTIIFNDTRGAFAGDRGPFRFNAKAGDTVRIQVQDWYGIHAGYEAIYITKPGGSPVLLEPQKDFTTPSGSKEIVLDKTYTLP